MNKERERRAIADLRRLYPEFPLGSIDEGESPDFVVRGAGSTVGIEVCEYFRPERPLGAHPMEQESLKHRIVDRATEICKTAGARGFLAPVAFARDVRITKRDAEEVARAVAQAILTRPAAFIENDGQLPACVEDVRVYDVGDKHEATVTYVDTTWLPPLDAAELARLVVAKEAKLVEYRQRCATAWLLIVVDGFRLSSWSEAPHLWPHLTSAFDRVLLLHDRRIVARIAG